LLDPKLTAIRVWLHHKWRGICDWSGNEAEEAELLALLDSSKSAPHPFSVLSIATSPMRQLRVARAASEAPQPDYGPRLAAGDKLRIGYLSSVFCRHAAAIPVTRLFELHDRSRFEITAYSHGPDISSI
jgi:protein O-GlcNAc transferase